MAAVFSQAGQSETWDMTRIIAGFFNFQLWSNLQIGLAIFGVLLMLPLLSIIGSFWRYYGYRLHRDDDTWRRHSGLVSKHDESIKQHKIQSIIWQQNLVARALGRINLRLKQTSAGVAVDTQGTGQKKQPAFIVPALHPADAEQLTGHLLPNSACLDTRFSRADRRYIVRMVLWGWSLPGVLIALLVAQAWDWRGLLIWPVVMAIGALVMTQCWRRLGYAVRGEYGLIRKGFLGSRISVFPLFKVQRVDIRQTPNQRRRRLAHLTIHLASHSLTLPWIRLEDAHQFRDLALYHVETSTQHWY